MLNRASASLRYRVGLLLAGLCWAFLAATGLWQLQTNIEDVLPWLPDDTPQRQDYDWYVETFGSDDQVIISWDGCHLDDPRLQSLAESLRRQDAKYVRAVLSPIETLDRVQQQSRLSREEAIGRLQGFLIGPDRQTTCLVVSLSSEGMHNRRQAVQAIIDRAREVTDISPEALHLGGRPYLGYYTSRITLEALLRLSIPVIILSTLLAWLALRDLPVLLITLCSSGAAALSSLSAVAWCGYELSGLLAALPSLVYVLATSGTIHLVNYAVDLDRTTGRFSPDIPATTRSRLLLRKALRPCALSSASTGLGTMSLVWSEFPAIRDFGIFATLGIAISFAVHILLIPPLLAWRFSAAAPPAEESPQSRRLGRLLDTVVTHRRLVIASGLLVTLLFTAPLFTLKSRFQISELFTSDSEFLIHAHWLEEHLGPVDATSVVLRFAPGEEHSLLQRVEQVQQLEQAVDRLDAIGATYSAATLLPDLTVRTSVLSRLFARAGLERRSEQFAQGGLVVDTPTGECWQISLRTSLFSDIDRRALRNEILDTAERLGRDWPNPPGVTVTGATQVFEESKDHVLGDFLGSLLLAFALILGLMVLALRSVVGGLLAMIPNVIPNIMVFGGLAWIDGAIDMGMTVAACIALGIAVDDTSHLLMSYRDERKSLPRSDALRRSFAQCGPAMCQTTLICGVAMLPYLWAELLYLSRFGLVIPLLMAAALLGDLLLLPALIAGPAGRWFDNGLNFSNPEECRSLPSVSSPTRPGGDR